MSGTWVLNFVKNNVTEEPEIPSIGSDSELVAWLRRKVKELDKLTCWERYKKFEDVYKILSENYYVSSGAVSFWQLLEWGLHGFVWWLKDPHTVYFDKQENDDFWKDLKWSYDFEWIGAVIGQSSDQIMIMEIIKESPAHKSWLKPLDVILQVDWKSVQGLSVRDVVNLVRGPKGTKVELTIFSEKEKKVNKVPVSREKIVIPWVVEKSFVQSGKKLGYISIATIGEDTAVKFKQALDNVVKTGAQGLIIDLRWNGWWILPIASDIASYFIAKDKIVTITKYKSLPEEVYYSKGLTLDRKMPIVILVDELSASASEILAYALRYQAGATLVWSQTFGKWSIQTLYTLTDNSSIKFTIGKRYTPDNLNVDKVGIKPDIEIKFDAKLFESNQTDNQLEKAKEVLASKIK